MWKIGTMFLIAPWRYIMDNKCSACNDTKIIFLKNKNGDEIDVKCCPICTDFGFLKFTPLSIIPDNPIAYSD